MNLFDGLKRSAAADYLAGMTPEQIEQELPKWLQGLRPDQFVAALAVAEREKQRREGQAVEDALRLAGL